MQNGFLRFGLQRGHFGCGGNGELALVNQVAHALDCLRHTDQAVELGDGHAHFLRQLRVALQLICGKAFLSAARLLLHALHLHPQGAGQVIAGNFVPVQVAVRHNDLGVRVANFLDNGGNGLIEHGGSNMAALAGQDFQPALFVEPGQHRVFDAHQFNGFQKLLEVLAFNIHGKIVVAGFLQIGRVEGDKIGLALFRGGQSFPRRLVRGREALLKNLRDSSPGRSLLGGGQGFALILTGRVCLCRTAFLGLSLRFVSIGEVSQGNGLARLRLGLQLGNGRCILFTGGGRGLVLLGRIAGGGRGLVLLGLLARGGGGFVLLGLLTGGGRGLVLLGRIAGGGGGLVLLGLLAGGGRGFVLLGLLTGGGRGLVVLGHIAGGGRAFVILGLIARGGGGLCTLAHILIGDRLKELAGDGSVGVVLHRLAVGDGLLHGHLIDMGGDVRLLRQLTGPAAAVAGQELILAVVPLAQNDRLLDAAALNAEYHTAQRFVLGLCDEHVGQVMDFGQRDHLELRLGRGFADFICHL